MNEEKKFDKIINDMKKTKDNIQECEKTINELKERFRKVIDTNNQTLEIMRQVLIDAEKYLNNVK